MTRRIVVKAAFENSYDRLSENDRKLVDKSLKVLQEYLETGKSPLGWGLKRLSQRTYEFRASLALRIVYLVEGEQVMLALLGSHDEVRRFLRRH